MALSTYVLQRNRQAGKTSVNGCFVMLHTVDPAVETTAALRLAAAIALANTAMGVTLPSDYFDVTEQLIGAAAGGYLPALGDNIVFTKEAQLIEIA